MRDNRQGLEICVTVSDLVLPHLSVCVHVCSCNLSVHAFIPPLRVSCGFLFCLCVSFVGLYVLVPRPDSAEGFSSCPSTGSRNGEKDWENDSTTSSTPSNAEYTGIQHGCTVYALWHLHSYMKLQSHACVFFPQDPNYTRSQVLSPTNTSSRMLWLTAAWLARSTKGRRTEYLMYVLQLCACVFLHQISFRTKQWGFLLCRKWRNLKPIASWCCSVTLDASSGLCTPTAPRRRRSPGWPASGRGASQPRWSRACTSTTRTGSSSAWSQPKPCPPVWTPSPSPVTCGKPRSRGRPKNCTLSSARRRGKIWTCVSRTNTEEFVDFTVSLKRTHCPL